MNRGFRGRGRPFNNRREVNPPLLEKIQIDRSKTCPSLIRVFLKAEEHNIDRDFEKIDSIKNEIKLYTWPDATMREIANLLKSIQPELRERAVRLSFCLVYPDSRGQYRLREISTMHSSRPGRDDNVQLHELRYQPGDFLDIAVLT